MAGLHVGVGVVVDFRWPALAFGMRDSASLRVSGFVAVGFFRGWQV